MDGLMKKGKLVRFRFYDGMGAFKLADFLMAELWVMPSARLNP
jgi:hypothetical protein